MTSTLSRPSDNARYLTPYRNLSRLWPDWHRAVTRAPSAEVLDKLVYGWEVYRRCPMHDDIEASIQARLDDKELNGCIDPELGQVVFDDEDRDEIKYEYEGYDNLDQMIDQVIGHGYIAEHELRFDAPAPPQARHQAIGRQRQPARRARQRRSHRVVRAVVKTAAGDSGDPDPEPPTTRRYLTAEVAP